MNETNDEPILIIENKKSFGKKIIETLYPLYVVLLLSTVNVLALIHRSILPIIARPVIRDLKVN